MSDQSKFLKLRTIEFKDKKGSMGILFTKKELTVDRHIVLSLVSKNVKIGKMYADYIMS